MTSRRDFLKLGAAAATVPVVGGTALSVAKAQFLKGKDFSYLTGQERQAIPTACWQCVTRCAAIGYVEDGRLVKIGPQPKSIRTAGFICAKGQAGVNQVYDPDRVLYPMKRVGKRGEGKWKRISWDEALTEVSARLKKLRDDGTPEKFMFHYGRMKASSSKLIKSVFLATYGTKTIGNHTSICEGGKWTAQELTWGKHYDNWDFDNTRFVLNFGSNCLEAHTNHVPTAHRLMPALVDRQVRMVTFDVRLSNTAAKSNEWIPVKPATDGAVALAMCNVIMSEDLYRGDGEAFLEFCKVTADVNATTQEKVAALKSHLAQYTPEWAQKISGVSADKIRSIAREFATARPAVVISYRGAVAHYNGNDQERAIQMLAAITGNIDNPGGRCKAVGAKWKYPKGPKKKPKAKKLKIIDGFPGTVTFPTHHVSHQVLKMIKDGRAGRPDVYMWYCYTPVYANGDVQENIDVLKDESLIPYTVCVNPFYDESAALADLILPDATYLERWDWEDMVSPNQVPEYYLRQPLVQPLGEARNFADVVCELAKRMGFPLGFNSMEEFVQKSCEKTPAVENAGGFEYMKKNGVWHDPNAKPRYYSYKKEVKAAKFGKDGVIFDEATGVYWNWKKSKAKSEEEARAKGYTKTKSAYKGYVGQKIGDKVYAGFKPDKLNKSGYFELYSGLMEAKGLAPLPIYTAIPEHEAIKKGELILTTYKVAVQTHSRTQNCKWLTEIYHDNPASINPVNAKALGISDGDPIRIRSKIAEIDTTAMVTPTVASGVVAVSHHVGHWEYGRYASGKKSPTGTDDDPELKRKWWKKYGAHPNWVIPNKPDPVNGQQCWMDAVVTVTKA
ncbi:MAG: thiosulfate reductase PhsA [Gammaproteobacteria bacterium]|nr:MAG: thiosulfate reductase PhsA [Gammaproteobacteria bacterium]